MTQKELLYLEDAVGHEDNIIKIAEDMIENLSDENLISFMQGELDSHMSIKNELINLLEVKVNE